MTLLSLFVAQSRNSNPDRAVPANGTSDDRKEPQTDQPLQMIEALARTMAARHGSTHEHARRVQLYALALAVEVSIDDDTTLAAIDAAALLHDIGKLGVPDRLLNKPGRLTADEYRRVKQHAIIGADLLSAVAFPGPLAVIVRHHHENWDGSGYPDGLRGDAIPIGARVLSIVDCYDALTSHRPYRRALPHNRAVEMIEERRGTMYDPEFVNAFLRIVKRAGGTGQQGVANPDAQSDASWLKARAV